MREGLGEYTAFNTVGEDWERVLNMGKGLENKKGLDCKEGLGNDGRDWDKWDDVSAMWQGSGPCVMGSGMHKMRSGTQ